MVAKKTETKVLSSFTKKATKKKKKNFSQQFLGKTKFRIRKIKEEKIFGSRARNAIYVLIIFFFAVIFINLQPNSNLHLENGLALNTASPDISYFFYDGDGNSYDIFGKAQEHGAPQSWEYLFEGINLDEISNDNTTTWSNEMGGNVGTEDQQPSITIDTEQWSWTQNTTGETVMSGEEQDPSTANTTTEEKEKTEKNTARKLLFVYQDIFINWRPYIKHEEKGIHIIDDYRSCSTPWGYSVQHGASVLAYQQDFNTPDMCKIERRFCWDGDLSWTFEQQSCSVNSDYSYFQEQFVSYNTNKKSDFVQPTATPSNSAEDLAKGNNQQGIEEIISRPNQGGTEWGTSWNTTSTTRPVDQTEREYPDCKTPRWETVKHGQFIKAYKHKNGFNDAPCQVQLRTCVVGQLEGSYQQLSCTHWDTSYIDWLNNSPTWETYSQAKLEWIKEIRENEENYKLEYGNNLKSEALDKILNILDL